MMPFRTSDRLKPILKWAGGKSGLLPQLFEYFPCQFNRYIEPFVGGGAVFLSLSPDIPAVICDANAEIVNLYSVIRDSPQEFMSSLKKLASLYSEEHYYLVRSQVPTHLIDAAARTVYLNKTGFNGLYRQNAKGRFNVPWGKREVCPALFVHDNILDVSKRLQNTRIVQTDFQAVLEECGAGDFIYCDPPYEPLSPTASFNSYKAGGFSQAEQIRLRESCVAAAQRGAQVVLSNSSAPFIQNLYKFDDFYLVRARRAINSKGTARGEVAEVLVRFGMATYAPK